jgi:hypothetical protein
MNETVFFLHLLIAGLMLLVAARMGRSAVTCFVVICTLLMNIAVMKQMTLFGLDVTGGNVLFASVFLANDILNEHYGRKEARKVVFLGFGSGLSVVILMQFVLWYVPNSYDEAQAHLLYFFNFGGYGRIVAASMVSYLLSQLLDTQLYHLFRTWTGTKRQLWLRCNASTWISQAFDTVFFTTAALTGSVIQSWAEWYQAVLFAFIIKVVVAALNTPFLYLTTMPGLVPPRSRRSAL